MSSTILSSGRYSSGSVIVISLTITVISDTDRKEFVHITDMVYDGFSLRLKELYPNLTAGDIETHKCLVTPKCSRLSLRARKYIQNKGNLHKIQVVFSQWKILRNARIIFFAYVCTYQKKQYLCSRI